MDILSLALTPKVGPKRLGLVLESGDFSSQNIHLILGAEIAESYQKVTKEGKAEKMLEQAARSNTRIIGIWEESYPERLKHLDSPPHVLYLKGEFPSVKSVGIVGTRKASAWANAWTRKISKELAEAGVGVISGLARGIDTESHKGALEGNGYTLGVLGSAVDKIYPSENTALAEKMHILSEVPMGMGSRAEFFPRRNRIIAGLANAVLVVEAGEKSGALITSKFAMELGRDVLAVPGRPGDINSFGTNKLIQDGAGLVCNTDDILFALGVRAPKKIEVVLEGNEERVYKALLELSEALPDDLSDSTSLPVFEVLGILTMLEIKGLVHNVPGGRYSSI